MPVILLEADAGGLQVQGQPGLYSETVSKKKKKNRAGCWWLTPMILATWEAEIGRITVQGQPGLQVFPQVLPHVAGMTGSGHHAQPLILFLTAAYYSF
jgi:hypothetical protein